MWPQRLPLRRRRGGAVAARRRARADAAPALRRGGCQGLADDRSGGVVFADTYSSGSAFVDYGNDVAFTLDASGASNHAVFAHFDAAGDAVSAFFIDAGSAVPENLRQKGGRVVFTGDFREAFDVDDAAYRPAGQADAAYVLLDFRPAP